MPALSRTDGKIKQLYFYGDFFCECDPTELAQKLIGVRYEPASIYSAAIQNVEYR